MIYSIENDAVFLIILKILYSAVYIEITDNVGFTLCLYCKLSQAPWVFWLAPIFGK